MNIGFVQKNLAAAFTLLEHQVFKPLSDKQKKVAFIAFAIFSALASCVLIYRRFRAKPHQFDPEKQLPRKQAEKKPVGMGALQKQAKGQPIVVGSPLKGPWKETKASFPNPTASAKIISQKDPFLEVLSPFDRQVRMRSNHQVSSEQFLSYYVKQIINCSSRKRSQINDWLEDINQKLKEYHVQLPETLHFIQTTGQEEIPGTAAYCRNHETIVFNWISHKLLAHELFHIYSRNNPEMRKKLYLLIGYHVIPPLSIPDQLQSKRLVNPDVPYLDAYIKVKYQGKTVQAVPLDLYDLNYKGPGKNQFLEGIYHKFALLEPGKNGEMQFQLDQSGSPILIDFDEAEDLEAQVGKNTHYIDSAEEILADNFALMITGWKAQAESPELIEKMEACFKKGLRG